MFSLWELELGCLVAIEVIIKYYVLNKSTKWDGVMQQVKISDLRSHLPDYIKMVSAGEQIQITSHGKIIARLVPEINEVEAAQKRLNAVMGSMIVGDIMEPLDVLWSADSDNL